MKQYLIFRLATEQYAIETTSVIQVTKEENLLEMPFLSQTIKGLMLIRNRMIPIVDTSTKWKVTKSSLDESKGHIIVMDLRGQLVGYWVDEVIKLVFWKEEEFLPIMWSKALRDKVWIKKMYVKNEESIGIIELEAFEME